MARDLSPGQIGHIRVDEVGTDLDLGGIAKSVSFWLQIDTTASEDCVFSGGDGFTTNRGIFLMMNHDAAGDLHCEIATSGTSCFVTSNSGILSTGTWYHITVTHDGVITDSSGLHIYVDGSEVGYSASQNGTGTEEDNSKIFFGKRPASGDYLNGKLAEAAWWTSELATTEITQLSAGYSPLFVDLDNMLCYSHLNGDNESIEVNVFGGSEWIISQLSGVTAYEHPRIIYPNRKQLKYTAPTGYMTESGGFWGAR